MRFEIDWASLIVGSKFTVFALFTLYLRAISKYKPPGPYIWRGDLTEGFCVTSLGGLCLEGLIHGGVYFRNLRYHTVKIIRIFTFKSTKAPRYFITSLGRVLHEYVWLFVTFCTNTRLYVTILRYNCALVIFLNFY